MTIKGKTSAKVIIRVSGKSSYNSLFFGRTIVTNKESVIKDIVKVRGGDIVELLGDDISFHLYDHRVRCLISRGSVRGVGEGGRVELLL